MRVCSDSERTTKRTGRIRMDASFEKHADEMQMMTWQRQRITGRHLAHRIRGVTTLLHKQEISSRDLRTETEGKRDDVKQELKRRSKESRALEKKRGTTRMTGIESSGNQIDYETTPVKTR